MQYRFVSEKSIDFTATYNSDISLEAHLPWQEWKTINPQITKDETKDTLAILGSESIIELGMVPIQSRAFLQMNVTGNSLTPL